MIYYINPFVVLLTGCQQAYTNYSWDLQYPADICYKFCITDETDFATAW